MNRKYKKQSGCRLPSDASKNTARHPPMRNRVSKRPTTHLLAVITADAGVGHQGVVVGVVTRDVVGKDGPQDSLHLSV